MPDAKKNRSVARVADAIEFTAEYRHAMGFFEDEPPPDVVTEVPSALELAQIPEWYAVNAWITAEENLACFGHSMQTIQTIRHQNTGKNNRWKNKKGSHVDRGS